jgi:ribosomal protein L44E
MAHELNRKQTESLHAPTSFAEGTTRGQGMSLRTAAETLGQILDRYRASKNWQAQSDADHNLTVAAWLEILDIAGVPVRHYESCYKAARQTQIECQAAGESVGPLGADELAAEWIKIRRLNEEIERTSVKMLAEVNPRHCLRCYGTGDEEMSDGTVRKGCAHEPLSDDEKAERNRLQRERVRFAREQAAHIGRPKPPVVERPKAPPMLSLTCSNCGRKVQRLYCEEGQTCGDLLNRGQGEGELKLCDGTLRPEGA